MGKKTNKMFGTCKCGKPNTGHYMGGSKGFCEECLPKEEQRIQDEYKKEYEKEKDKLADALFLKATETAKRLNITLSEAILLLKNI